MQAGDASQAFAPNEVGRQIVRALRQVDKEARPRSNGQPTGVRWYNGHLDHSLDPDGKAQSRVEDLWSNRVGQLLSLNEITASNQVRYPGTRQKCDLVLRPNDGRHFWIEVKGAWTEYAYSYGPVVNRAYKKYIYSTADDINKLCALQKPEADWVGLLLLGFDRAQRPITEADLDIIRTRCHSGWDESADGWDEQWWTGYRVRAWFWWRPAG
jgi:hypothetical protein